MPVGTAGRRCAAIIADLEIPRPFDLRLFVAQVEARRNRRIFLHPFTSGPGIPCGLWLRTARADHIFCEQGTTPWHRTHITLHEIAHMLLAHDRGQSGAHELAGLLAPGLNPAMVRMVLGRSSYSTAEERDAETLASLVLGQATASQARRPLLRAGAVKSWAATHTPDAGTSPHCPDDGYHGHAL